MEQIKYQEKRFSDVLNKVIVDEIVPLLSNGICHSYTPNELTKSRIKLIYQNIIILLFRLLTIMAIEDRSILPTNNEYYEYSLLQIRREVVKRLDNGYEYSTTATSLYKRIQTLFLLFHQGNDKLRIFPYPGNLFHDQSILNSESMIIPDHILSKVIKKLSRAEEVIHGSENWIDYSYISGKHLGSIYESLLGFKLVRSEKYTDLLEKKPDKEIMDVSVQTVDLTLTRDIKERKKVGLFYTPDYIIDFIIHETIDPTLRTIKEDFISDFEKLNYTNTLSTKEKLMLLENKDPVERILNLRILDPAVGTGLFLIAAFEHLSEWIEELLEESFQIDNYSYIFTPLKSLKNNQLQPIKYIQRLILKKCLFGVDLDPLAIEITKLSLWLALKPTLECPAIFLDHHIRVGNSLLGINLEDLPNYVKKELFSYLETNEIRNDQLNMLLSSLDLSSNDFQESKLNYQRVEDSVKDLKSAFDFYLWTLLQTLKAEKNERDQAITFSKSFFKRKNILKILEFEKNILNKAKKDSYFHWGLEFPELLTLQPENKHIPTSLKRFDFIVTNPPFGGRILDKHKTYFKNQYGTPKDTAAYFIRKMLRISNCYGLILPKSIAFYSHWTEVRKAIMNESNLYHVLDTGLAFEDANYETLILIGDRKKSIETKISIAKPLRSPIKRKKIVEDGYIPIHLIHKKGVILFRGLSQRELEVLEIMINASIPLKSVIKDKNNIFRGLYIPDRIKKEIVSGKSFILPEISDTSSNNFIWIDKVPHVKKYQIVRFHILNLSSEEHQKYLEKVQKIQVPRVFLKVLRGNRLI
ncbi:MAG: Eco57I restriction-modification methylase domain-containing protein, partial [Promethearchaeota archaeon]